MNPPPLRRGVVPRPPCTMSILELEAWAAIHGAGFATPECQRLFLKSRRWRWDFAWPDRMIALEVDGGVWLGQGHTGGKGFMADCEKRSVAAAIGWTVITCAGEQIGDAMGWLAIAFGDAAKPL